MQDCLYNQFVTAVLNGGTGSLTSASSLYFIKKIIKGVKTMTKVYWYKMLRRPMGIDCQPKGWVDSDHTIGRFGIVAYERLLTVDELDEYEMEKYAVTVECDCGDLVTIDNSWANCCLNCEVEYNGLGEPLAPREQWGYETRERF